MHETCKARLKLAHVHKIKTLQLLDERPSLSQTLLNWEQSFVF
jgi:hypothetical protein